MRTVALALVALAGAAFVGLAQPRADATRTRRAIDDALVFVPDGRALRAAASGFEEPLADLLWVRTVLIFGDRFHRSSGAGWTEWVRRMLLTVSTLDPVWRTPYFYGGAFLRVVGNVEAADQVYLRAMENLPDDPWFPFAYGMNHYLEREDAATAAEWIGRASRLPGAPSWYGAAAAAMRQEAGDRQAGIRFLEQMRAETTDPAVLEDTDRQLRRLWHNEYVARWEAICRDFRAREGRPLRDVAELERLVGPLPSNPRGDAWMVGGDGVVRSESAEAERLRRARRDEWRLIVR
ncbi:MAG: hypothetical protein ACOZNI_16320 [Myxococcota bacterium]